MNFEMGKYQRLLIFILIVIGLCGVALRFFNITDNHFVYYDEGLYLAHNIDFLYYMEQNPPDSIQKLLRYLTLQVENV